MERETASSDGKDVEFLITASEAYPAFERAFLATRREAILSFRIFDPWTELRSSEAREIGKTWFDLIAHKLAQGVRLTIIVNDFDPIALPDMHRVSWESLRSLVAAGEASGRPENLEARVAMHPARVGWLSCLGFWPLSRKELSGTAKRINDLPTRERQRFYERTPYLWRHMKLERGLLRLIHGVLPRLVPVTHHQKLAVFDQEVLYIGGLDLDERRYDSKQHEEPADQTWHDVQVLVRGGPKVADAHAHLKTFEASTAGATPPELPNVLRTLSQRRDSGFLHLSPRFCLREIESAHRVAVSRARRLIYLESQFFRDTRLAKHFAKRADENRDLTLILVLPAAPDDVAFENRSGGDARYGEYLQAKCVDILMTGFGDRMTLVSPAQPRRGTETGRATLYDAPLVYVHAKVSVFDDTEAIVSSANLNGRSLKWDTEAGIRLDDPGAIVRFRERLFSHWLGPDAGPEFFDPKTAQIAWRERARSNARLAPEDRVGFMLPYASRPARRFGRNLPGIPEEMV
ncbi:phospholipase D-like domain-containing protein [Sulfitobacter sp. D35]|uniref:phospholipase D family protein n=1 Tax=Sulfitobacter sp. D35 TaxID=3083252 RepID=UPI00296F02E3|nr:phospholipase D-like domain-containing protein [Sulfitobacter sp. D35]MDW4499895.1 phospholipase D-like domain-containing protein [Sulfitobacter sp. D35]